MENFDYVWSPYTSSITTFILPKLSETSSHISEKETPNFCSALDSAATAEAKGISILLKTSQHKQQPKHGFRSLTLGFQLWKVRFDLANYSLNQIPRVHHKCLNSWKQNRRGRCNIRGMCLSIFHMILLGLRSLAAIPVKKTEFLWNSRLWTKADTSASVLAEAGELWACVALFDFITPNPLVPFQNCFLSFKYTVNRKL